MSEAWSHAQIQRREKPPRAASATKLRMNVLPPRYRPRRLTLRSIAPWLLLLTLAGLVFPANARFREAAAAFQAVESHYEQVREALAAYSPLIAEAEALQTQIEAETARADAIEAIYADVQIQQVVWGEMISKVLAAQPENLFILSIDQLDDEVSLSGTADSHATVLKLQSNLRATSLFDEVEILSITLIPEEAEATPPPAEGETAEGEMPSAAEVQRYSFEMRLLVPLADATAEGQ